MGAILRVGLRMILLNGNTTPRVRSSEGCTVLPCGCAHTEREWLQLCDAHGSEWQSLHDAARIAHAATLHGAVGATTRSKVP